MYPWYRESVSQLGQFCAPGNPMSTTIKTENGYNDCMLALDYAAQSKVSAVSLNALIARNIEMSNSIDRLTDQ